MKAEHIKYIISVALCIFVYTTLYASRSPITISEGGINTQSDDGMINYINFREALQRNEKNAPELLIVCTNENREHIRKFIRWKNSLGFECHTLVCNNMKYDSIKKLIDDILYKTDFILIVGSPDSIPSYKDTMYSNIQTSADIQDVIYSDFFYGMNDVKYNSTSRIVPVGRIAGASQEEEISIIDKIINYEAYPPRDESFYNSFLFSAHMEDTDNDGTENRGDLFTSETIASTLESKFGKTAHRLYCTDSKSPKQYNAKFGNGSAIPALIRNIIRRNEINFEETLEYLNQGVNLWSYYGHGNNSGFVDPFFHTEHLKDLRNRDHLPIILSYACSTISFSNLWRDSFGIRAQNFSDPADDVQGGCIAFVGTTCNSLVPIAQAFTLGFYDALWPHSDLRPQIGLFLYPDNIRDTPDTSQRLGYVINQARYRMMESVNEKISQPKALYNAVIFNLLGDPTMRLNSAQPKYAKNPSIKVITTANKQMANIKIEADAAVDRITLYDTKTNTCKSYRGNQASFDTPYSNDLVISLTGENIVPYFEGISMTGDVHLQNLNYNGVYNYTGKIAHIGNQLNLDNKNPIHIDDSSISINCEEIEILPGFEILGDGLVNIKITKE